MWHKIRAGARVCIGANGCELRSGGTRFGLDGWLTGLVEAYFVSLPTASPVDTMFSCRKPTGTISLGK